MDFGQAKPYAVLWFAVDFDGNLYAYRELYGWGGKPNVGTGETARMNDDLATSHQPLAQSEREVGVDRNSRLQGNVET